MAYMNSRGGVKAYHNVGVHGGVMDASPHHLIQMLMQGVLDKAAAAKGYMEQGEISEKCKYISWAISIVDGLRASLDKDSGGEIATNLDGLYDYMSRQLFEANVKNDVAKIDEVIQLMLEIKSAWDVIPPDAAEKSNAVAGQSTI